jgi:hypothetical protein
MKKRLLAALLTLCLLFSLLPVGAMAAETAAGKLPEAEENVVTLESDVTLTSSDTLPDISYTYYLNGHTLTLADGATLGNGANPVSVKIYGDNGKLVLAGDGIDVKAGSDLVIDKTTVTNASGAAITVEGNAKLTVTNSTINAGGGKSAVLVKGASQPSETGAEVTLTSDTLKSAGGTNNANSAVVMNVDGKLTISDCTITGGNNAVAVLAGTAVIDGSTLSIDTDAASSATVSSQWTETSIGPAALAVGTYNNSTVTNSAAAKVTVTGKTTITGKTDDTAIPAIDLEGNTTIKTSTVIISDAATTVTGAVNNGKNTAGYDITAGTFSTDVQSVLVDPYKAVKTEDTPATAEKEATYKYVVQRLVVATTGSEATKNLVEYATLSAALKAAAGATADTTDAAKAAKTVELLADTEESLTNLPTATQSATINLNGHTVTLANTTTINTPGTLTINGGGGKIVGGNSVAANTALITNTGTLTLDNVTVDPGAKATRAIKITDGTVNLTGTTEIKNATTKATNDANAYAIEIAPGNTKSPVLNVKSGITEDQPTETTKVTVGNILLTKGGTSITMNIEMGTFGKIDPSATGSCTINKTITGGTFGSDVSTYVPTAGAYVCVEDKDNKVWNVTEDIAATITTTSGNTTTVHKYNTLDEAIKDNANNNAVIVLQKNISEVLSIAKASTIDLNGYTITGLNQSGDGIKVTATGTVTLENGKLTSGEDAKNVIYSTATTLTLRDIEIVPGDDVTTTVKSTKNLTLEGTTKIPNAPNKAADDPKALNLAIDLTAGAAATLKVDSVKIGETTVEPNVEVGNVKVVAAESKVVTLAIAQGKFGIITTTDLSTGDITGKEKETYITGELTGGTFGSDVTNYVQAASAYAAVKTGEATWKVQEDVVAILGSGDTATKYHKLSDAVSKANTTDTITLVQDTTDHLVIDNKNITLNLGTYTLTTSTTTEDGTGKGIEVYANATLTINGGTITSQEAKAAVEENGVVTQAKVCGVGIVIDNKGTLTLNNTTVELGASSTVAINNNGTSNSPKLTLAGTTTVKNAKTIPATTSCPDYIAVKILKTADLTVAKDSKVTVGNVWVYVDSGTVNLNIASGKFGTVYITNGSLSGNKITGGTFNSDVSDLVPDNDVYVVVKNPDGTFTVKNDAVASITTGTGASAKTDYYKTVSGAIDAVSSTTDPLTVVKLEKDVTEATFDWKTSSSDYDYVLDLNEHTLTLEGTNAAGISIASTISTSASIEIKNGTISSTKATTVIAISGSANVTLTDVTVAPDSQALVSISNAGTLTLAGTTTVNGGKNAAIQNSAATLVVKSVKDKDTDAETTNVTVGKMSVSGANVLNIELGTFGEVDIDTGATITDTTDVAATDSTPAKCNSHIIGGTFGSDVTKLCHTGYAAVKSGDTYEVKTIESVLAQTQVTETAVVGTTDVKASGDEATKLGNSVKADLSAKGVAIVDAETAAAEKEAALKALTSTGKVTINADGTTSVPVTIVRVVDLTVQVNSVDTTNKTVSVSVTPTYKAYAFAGDLPEKQGEYSDKGTLVTVDNKGKASNDAQAAAISGNVVVNVTLPASIAGTATQAYVTHTSGKTTSYYTATVKENVATFTTDGFSTFVISLTNPNPITSAKISGDAAVIAGKTTQLELNPTPADAVLEGTIEWTSSDETIATVKDGLVTGVAAGKATITAKVDGVEATIEITVQPAVESVTLNKTAVTLQPGKTETLEATIAPEGAVVAGEIEWKSSDEAVATVEDGVITAVANGDATITVTVDGQTATCKVTVETPADDILTNAAAVTLEAGKSQTVKITVTPADSSDEAEATSSNTAIATVTNNNDGTITITAVAAGDADIIVKAGNKTLTIPVNVPGDKTDDNAANPPADNNGETTKPDDNQGDTTKPDDNKGDTTKPDDNKGDTTKPDDNKVDDKNEEPTTPVFTDLTQDWYKDAVNWAAKEGITTGTTATTFNPNGTCTRAMVVTFLWRAAGSPEPKSTTTSFTDVNANEYYAKAVAWAVENGITTGTSTTTFSPNAACTRAQVVTFLWRAANKPVVSSTTSFTVVAAGSYYADAVNWAVANGITTGMSSTTFQPNTTCTRGMVVTFLYRAQ